MKSPLYSRPESGMRLHIYTSHALFAILRDPLLIGSNPLAHPLLAFFLLCRCAYLSQTLVPTANTLFLDTDAR